MAKKRRLASEILGLRRAVQPAPDRLRPEQAAVVRAVAGALRKLADVLTELFPPPEGR